ncbi:cytochrome P450 [Dactylosporangium sp. NPDC005572]|uniref:cytochrome P450 n=1 Tax=Dactylosporangium sp. NPDC005572 TaxID=3156889 RepID=UPI0033BC99C1
MTTAANVRVSIGDIPGLDPSPLYTVKQDRTPSGIPQVVLPSGHTAAHLTRFKDVKAVLMDSSFSRSVTNTPDGPSFLPTITPPELLINLDLPHHPRLRALVTSDYSANAMGALLPALEGLITARFAALRASDRPDLFADVLDEIPLRFNCLLLGIPDEDVPYFRPSARIVQIAARDDVDGLVEHFFLVYNYVLDLVGGRRPVRPDGLIARLLAARDRSDPPLTDADLAGLVLASVLGGDQNSLSVLTKSAYALLAAPPLWHRLVAEPDVAPRLVEELIRFIPLGRMSAFPRVATRPFRSTEGELGEGDLVYPNAFLANRDPEVYRDPLVIDPDRTGPRHLQFGYGMHHCLGAAMSRLQIATVLTRLAAEFPELSLDADPATLPWDDGVLLRRPTALPVRW